MAKELEAEDIELKDYIFTPKEITVNGNSVIDYTDVENDKVFLCNRKDILDKPRPSWIPELDEKGLALDNFLPVCVKDFSDGNNFVQSKVYTGTRDANGKPVYKNQIYKMSSDVLAATVDYYLKRKRAELKREGSTEKVSLPRGMNSMPTKRYNEISNLCLLCNVPSLKYKDVDKSITDKAFEMKGKTPGKLYHIQNEVVFLEQWQPLLENIKGKRLDMNYQKQDYIDSYSKAVETAYGDSNTFNNLYNDYGVKIKKQNGSNFSKTEIDRLSETIEKVFNHYGNLSALASDYGLKVSYADNCMQFASKYIGIFSPFRNVIGVSFFNEEKQESVAGINHTADVTLAHEIAHWLDNQKGKESHSFYASDKYGTLENQIAEKFKNEIKLREKSNKSAAKIGKADEIHLGEYWFRTCECFARAMEQYYAFQRGIDLSEEISYARKDNFEADFVPLIEQLMEENKRLFSLGIENNQNVIEKKQELNDVETSSNSSVLDVYIASNEKLFLLIQDKLEKEGLKRWSSGYYDSENHIINGSISEYLKHNPLYIIPDNNSFIVVSKNYLDSKYNNFELNYLNENLELEIKNEQSGLSAKSYYNSKNTRKLCHIIKEADRNSEEYKNAIEQMADYFVKQGIFNEKSILVPAPQHTGKAEYTWHLAAAISQKTNSPIADILRCKPHETLYEQKKNGIEPDVEFYLENAKGVKDLENLFDETTMEFWKRNKDKVYLLDNNISTGLTFNKAEKLLPGLIPAPYAIGNFAEITFKEGRYTVNNLLEEKALNLEINTKENGMDNNINILDKDLSVLESIGFNEVSDSKEINNILKNCRKLKTEIKDFYNNINSENSRIYRFDGNVPQSEWRSEVDGTPLYVINYNGTWNAVQDKTALDPGKTFYHVESFPELGGLIIHFGEKTNLSHEEATHKELWVKCPNNNIKITPEKILKLGILSEKNKDFYRTGNFDRFFYQKLKSAILEDDKTKAVEIESENKNERIFTVDATILSAVDRADFLASLEHYVNGEKKGKDVYKIKETLNKENLKPVRFIYEGYGYMGDSIYESFVCKNYDNPGFRYIMVPHNAEYYKGYDKLIVSDKTFSDIEECQSALIETLVNLKENHNFNIETKTCQFWNLPEKFKQPLLTYIAENEKEICKKTEEWFDAHPDFEKHENIKDNISVYLIREPETVNFNSPQWLKIFEKIELSINNPLLADTIEVNKQKENKLMEETKELKENNEHARNVIDAFKELDEVLKNSSIAKDGLYIEPSFLYEKEKELFSEQSVNNNNTIEIKPVTLEEILDVMDMRLDYTANGNFMIYDTQRQEYISSWVGMEDDNGTAVFSNAAEAFERLDIYINDYYFNDMQEQLEACGIEIKGNETLSDLCKLYKTELEKGNEKLSPGELNLAMGIVEPGTVLYEQKLAKEMSEEKTIQPEFVIYNKVDDEKILELKEHLKNNGYDVNWHDKDENNSFARFTCDIEQKAYIQTILEERGIDYEYTLGLLASGYDAAWLNEDEQFDAEIVSEKEFKRINEIKEKEYKDLKLPYIKIDFTESSGSKHKLARMESGTVLGLKEGEELLTELNNRFNTFLKADVTVHFPDAGDNEPGSYSLRYDFTDDVRHLDDGREIPFEREGLSDYIRMTCSYPEVLEKYEQQWQKINASNITEEQKKLIADIIEPNYEKLKKSYKQHCETLKSVIENDRKVHSSWIVNKEVSDASKTSLEAEKDAVAVSFERYAGRCINSIADYLDENKDLSFKNEFINYAEHQISNMLQDVKYGESRNAKYGEHGYDFDFTLWRHSLEKVMDASEYNSFFTERLQIEEKRYKEIRTAAKDMGMTKDETFALSNEEWRACDELAEEAKMDWWFEEYGSDGEIHKNVSKQDLDDLSTAFDGEMRISKENENVVRKLFNDKEIDFNETYLLSSEEANAKAENLYGFRFEYNAEEKVVDVFNNNTNAWLGITDESGFNYAADISPDDNDAERYHIPDEVFKDVTDLASQFFTECRSHSYDFASLADDIIQQAYENSGDGFNYIMDFNTVAGIAGKDVQWVKNNITNICDALYKFNDNFLLEFNEEEALAEENEINMYFCSVGEDANELFKKGEDGRWIRKTDEELRQEGFENDFHVELSYDQLVSAFKQEEKGSVFIKNWEAVKTERPFRSVDNEELRNKEEAVARTFEDIVDDKGLKAICVSLISGAVTLSDLGLSSKDYENIVEGMKSVYETIGVEIVAGNEVISKENSIQNIFEKIMKEDSSLSELQHLFDEGILPFDLASYLLDEDNTIDTGIEKIQANGGMSDAAIEADYEAQMKEQEAEIDNDIDEEPVWIINGEPFTEKIIEESLHNDVAALFEQYDSGEVEENLTLVGVKMYRNPTNDGKISLLVEFDSKNPENRWREDSLFNALNEEGIEFNGMKVDFNPITREKSGTIEQYLKTLSGFENEEQLIKANAQKLEEKEVENKLNEISSKLSEAVNGKNKILPFSIINNKEKGRVNIKFDTVENNPEFNDILKELKANGWKYAPSTKQWYPVGNAVNKAEDFANRLQEKYSVSLNKGMEKPMDIGEEKSPYDGIRFFDRNYNEPHDFAQYFNSNLHLFKKSSQEAITEEEAATILKAVGSEKFAIAETRNVRIGLDMKDNIVILNKSGNDIEKSSMSLPEFFEYAKESARENLEDSKQMLENYLGKEHPVKDLEDIFVRLYETCIEQCEQVNSNMQKLYDSFYPKENEVSKSAVLYQRNSYRGWEISADKDFKKSVYVRPFEQTDRSGYILMAGKEGKDGFWQEKFIREMLKINNWSERAALVETLTTLASDKDVCNSLGIKEPQSLNGFLASIDKIIKTENDTDIKAELLNNLLGPAEAQKLSEKQNSKSPSKESIPELTVGDSVGKDKAIDVFKIADGVYQASLSRDENGVGSAQNYFVIDNSIVQQLNSELKELVVSFDSRSVIENKAYEPYILRELISKNFMPPRDEDFVQKLNEYISVHPLKYEKLKPVDYLNFERKLKEIAEVDKEFNKTPFELGQQLVALVDESDRPKLMDWLKNKQGCDSPENMKRVFASWLREDPEQKKDVNRKKENGYPPRGEN